MSLIGQVKNGKIELNGATALPEGAFVRVELIEGNQAPLLDADGRTLGEKLMTYALGRGVEYFDQPAIRKITRGAAPEYRWSSIVLGIVKSTPFQQRRSQETAVAAVH